MPRRILLSCIRVLIVAAAIACVLDLHHRSLADEPAVAKQMVEVKLWVVEVSITKLRTLGFDWDAMRSGPAKQKPVGVMQDETFDGFLQALDQNNLARTLAKPMIATRSGQKASIDISPYYKFDVTPTISDAEHIEFAYHVDVATDRDAQPDKASRRMLSACSTELKSGAVQLLSETTTERRTAKGELFQTKILVLAQATIVK